MTDVSHARLPLQQAPFIRFELLEDLIPDGTGLAAARSASALVGVRRVRNPDPSDSSNETWELGAAIGDPYEPITVWDAFGTVFAWGRDPDLGGGGIFAYASIHQRGAMGYAAWVADKRRYEIVSIGRPLIFGKLQSAPAGLMCSLWRFDPDYLHLIEPWTHTVDSGYDVLVAAKRSAQTPWLGDSQFQYGDDVVLDFDGPTGEYYIIDGPVLHAGTHSH